MTREGAGLAVMDAGGGGGAFSRRDDGCHGDGASDSGDDLGGGDCGSDGGTEDGGADGGGFRASLVSTSVMFLKNDWARRRKAAARRARQGRH